MAETEAQRQQRLAEQNRLLLEGGDAVFGEVYKNLSPFKRYLVDRGKYNLTELVSEYEQANKPAPVTVPEPTTEDSTKQNSLLGRVGAATVGATGLAFQEWKDKFTRSDFENLDFYLSRTPEDLAAMEAEAKALVESSRFAGTRGDGAAMRAASIYETVSKARALQADPDARAKLQSLVDTLAQSSEDKKKFNQLLEDNDFLRTARAVSSLAGQPEQAVSALGAGIAMVPGGQLPGAAVAAVGAGTTAKVAYDAAYADARTEGGLTPDEASSFAKWMASSEYVGELAGVVGGGPAAKTVIKSALREWIKRGGKAAVREGLSEAGTGVLQDVGNLAISETAQEGGRVAKYAESQLPTSAGDFATRRYDEFLAGALMGGGVSAPINAAQVRQDVAVQKMTDNLIAAANISGAKPETVATAAAGVEAAKQMQLDLQGGQGTAPAPAPEVTPPLQRDLFADRSQVGALRETAANSAALAEEAQGRINEALQMDLPVDPFDIAQRDRNLENAQQANELADKQALGRTATQQELPLEGGQGTAPKFTDAKTRTGEVLVKNLETGEVTSRNDQRIAETKIRQQREAAEATTKAKKKWEGTRTKYEKTLLETAAATGKDSNWVRSRMNVWDQMNPMPTEQSIITERQKKAQENLAKIEKMVPAETAGATVTAAPKKGKQPKAPKVTVPSQDLSKRYGLESVSTPVKQSPNVSPEADDAKLGAIAESLVRGLGVRKSNELGKALAKNKVKVVRHASQLPNWSGSKTEGLYDAEDGSVYLVASELTDKTAVPTILHELAHKLRDTDKDQWDKSVGKLVGTDEGRKIASKLRALASKDKSAAAALRRAEAARDRAEPARKEYVYIEELIGYSVTEAAKARASGSVVPLRGVVQDIINAVKSAASKYFGMDVNVTPEMLEYMVRKNLGKIAEADTTKKTTDKMESVGGQKATGFAQAKKDKKVYRGRVDRQERFVISDVDARITDDVDSLNDLAKGEVLTLGEVLQHSKLYQNYPDLNNTKVIVDPSIPEFGAMFDSTTNTIHLDTAVVNLALEGKPNSMLRNVLHETQHAIQEMEGFIGGTNAEALIPASIKEAYKLAKAGYDEAALRYPVAKALAGLDADSRKEYMAAMNSMGGSPTKTDRGRVFLSMGFAARLKNETPEIRVWRETFEKNKAKLIKAKTAYDAAYDDAFKLYLRDYGEAEARAVEFARGLTEDEIEARGGMEAMISFARGGVTAADTLDTLPIAIAQQKANATAVTRALESVADDNLDSEVNIQSALLSNNILKAVLGKPDPASLDDMADKLIVTHTVSSSSFTKMMQTGGMMVMPSLAVTGGNGRVPTEFGNITLILKKNFMAPSRKQSVVGADAYTPRAAVRAAAALDNSVEFGMLEDDGKLLDKTVREVAKVIDDSAELLFDEDFEQAIANTLGDEEVLMTTSLTSEQKYNTEVLAGNITEAFLNELVNEPSFWEKVVKRADDLESLGYDALGVGIATESVLVYSRAVNKVINDDNSATKQADIALATAIAVEYVSTKISKAIADKYPANGIGVTVKPSNWKGGRVPADTRAGRRALAVRTVKNAESGWTRKRMVEEIIRLGESTPLSSAAGFLAFAKPNIYTPLQLKAESKYLNKYRRDKDFYDQWNNSYGAVTKIATTLTAALNGLLGGKRLSLDILATIAILKPSALERRLDEVLSYIEGTFVANRLKDNMAVSYNETALQKGAALALLARVAWVDYFEVKRAGRVPINKDTVVAIAVSGILPENMSKRLVGTTLEGIPVIQQDEEALTQIQTLEDEVPNASDAIFDTAKEAYLPKALESVVADDDAESATDVLMRTAATLLTPTQGLGRELFEIRDYARNVTAERAAKAEQLQAQWKDAIRKQAAKLDLDEDAFLDKLAKEVDAIDAIDDKQKRENAMDLLEAKYPGVGKGLRRLRDFKWSMTKEIIRLREKDSRPLTEEEDALYAKMVANAERYNTRAYASMMGGKERSKEYGRQFLKRAKVNPNSQEGKDLAAGVQFLIDNVLLVPDRAAMEQLSKGQIGRMYEAWIGPKLRGKGAKKKMMDKLETIGTKNRDVLEAKALEIIREMLGQSKDMGAVAAYYRGGKIDRTILNRKTNVPPEIRKILGEVTDPYLRESITLARMSQLIGHLTLPTEIAAAGKGTWYSDDKGGEFQYQLKGNVYGALEDKWVTRKVYDTMTDINQFYTNFDDALKSASHDASALAKYAADAALPVLGRLSSLDKKANIVGNLSYFLVNLVGAATIMAPMNGLVNPGTYMKGFAGAMKAGVATTFKDMSDQTMTTVQELIKAGVLDQPTVGEFKGQVYRDIFDKLEKLNTADRSYMWKAGKIIWDGIANGRRFDRSKPVEFLTEVYAMMDVWVKVATYYDRKNFLTEYNRLNNGNMTEDQIIRQAGLDASTTNVSYKLAIPAIRMLERNIPGFMFWTYFSETFRVTAMSYAQAYRDASMAVNAETAGAKALATWQASKRLIGTSAMIAGWTALITSMLEGEDEEDKDKRKLRAEYLENSVLIPIGQTKDGKDAYVPLDRVHPMGPVTELAVAVARAEDKPEALVEFINGMFVKNEGFWRVAQLVNDATLAPMGITEDMRRKKTTMTEKDYPEVYDQMRKWLGAGDIGENMVAVIERYIPSSARVPIYESSNPLDYEKSDPNAYALVNLGFKPVVDDPNKDLGFKAMDYNSAVRTVREEWKDFLATPRASNAEEVLDTMTDLLEQEREAFDKLRDAYDGYVAFDGMTPPKAVVELEANRIPKKVATAVRYGRFQSQFATPDAVNRWYDNAVKKLDRRAPDYAQRRDLLKQQRRLLLDTIRGTRND